ncbi:hypothetical protein SESBI_00496 [Sesbania bispinosa]|nr:hypothetical protein SESBI_00496 [Sesbania bispinosa]
MKEDITRTLKPVTSAKEVAMATPEKEISIPRCPTIMSDTTCRSSGVASSLPISLELSMQRAMFLKQVRWVISTQELYMNFPEFSMSSPVASNGG